MKRHLLLLAALLTIAAVSCAERGGDDPLEPRSRGTGESDERLGNDPAEQNTGAGSTRDAERPQGNPPQ
jgi:hypothetical protein